MLIFINFGFGYVFTALHVSGTIFEFSECLTHCCGTDFDQGAPFTVKKGGQEFLVLLCTPHPHDGTHPLASLGDIPWLWHKS
jgi:hypothetical protein